VQLGLVALVLVVGVISAVIAWNQEADAARRDEEASTQQATDLLEGVGRQIEASLAGSAGLVRADGSFNTAAFQRFALELTRSSDLTALAFEPVVAEDQRDEWENRTGQEIVDWDADGSRPSPARAEHFPVEVVAPETQDTRDLIGFDLQGDPTRRDAALLARESRALVVSEPVAAQPSGSPSFFVIKALFGPEDSPAAGQHVGFISTAFPGSRLAQLLEENLPAGDRFRVSDGGAVLASSDPPPSTGLSNTIGVAGRRWTVAIDSGAEPDHRVAWLLGLVALVLAGGMVAFFVRAQAHNRSLDENSRRAELLADLAQRLNGADTVDAVAEVVTTFGRTPVGAAAASIGVIEDGELDVRHGDTVPEEYRRERRVIALDAPLGFAVAAATGEPLRFEDQTAYDEQFPDAGGPPGGGRAFHPIRRANGVTIGAVAHLWEEPIVFDDALVSTLRTIADLTGQAVERARLAEATAREARIAEDLAALAQELASRTSSDDVTTFLTRAVLAPLEADHAAVAVVEGNQLRRHFTPGPITELLHELLPETVPLDDQSPLAEAARTGEVVLLPTEAALEARYPHLAEGWIGLGFRATANLPLRDRSGRLIGALGVAWNHPIDAEEVLDRLATVAGIAGQTLDRARLVERVTTQARHSDAMATLAEVLVTARSADDVVEAVIQHAAAAVDADRVNVALVDEASGELVVHHHPTTAPDLRDRYHRLDPDARVPHVDALRLHQAIAAGNREDFALLYPDLAHALAPWGVHALAANPMRDSRGRDLGAVGFVWDHPIPDDELPRVELRNIADLCAQALERAMLADAEHRLALTMQDTVLQPLPDAVGLRATARYLPASEAVGIGGDWYEGIVRADGRYLVVVGDVAGHGVTAVAQMAQLRASLGTVARLDVPVDEILPQVSLAGRRGEIAIATAGVVEIDPVAGVVRYACAGHPPPLIRLPSGAVVALEDGRQPLLGMAMQPVAAGVADFPEGAVLLCYTDGLIERRDEPIDVSIARLATFFEGVGTDDVEEIADAVLQRWRSQESPIDDVALVVIANVPT
jgi:serine phosphatase RsbU (regulator of sigma subunit)/CHASE1-domain containing sensor protein/GAF domain-containing protein